MDRTNNSDSLRYLSVCSGIEAATVAWHELGWEAVAYAEIEKFPSAVLAHHYPGVPNLGDFTRIDTSALGRVDILAGGTPCQAFSVAGARRSLDDARGNLTLAFVELAHELADGNGLRNLVWENVPGVLSTKDNAFGCFLGALVGACAPCIPVEPRPADGRSSRWWRWTARERAHAVRWPRYGVVVGPKGRAAWAVKDAQFYGVAQRRERVLVVADFGGGADPFEVLFEPESVRRDSPPSREAGQGVAGTVAGGARKSGGYSHDDLPLTPVAFGGNRTSGALEVATAVNAHGGPHGRLDFESETFVCVHGTQDPCTSEETAFTLGRNSGQENVIAFDTTQITSAANRSNPKAGDPCHPLSAQAHPPAIVGSAVRRLTPRECERLQGFPDDYTRISWRGKSASECPDGPRYKALGNSWAVPKFTWLGRRIAMLMPANAPHLSAANDNREEARHVA